MLAGPRPSSISGLQPRDDGDDQRGQERFSRDWRQTDTPTARNDEDDGCRVKAGQSSRTQHLGFSICFWSTSSSSLSKQRCWHNRRSTLISANQISLFHRIWASFSSISLCIVEMWPCLLQQPRLNILSVQQGQQQRRTTAHARQPDPRFGFIERWETLLTPSTCSFRGQTQKKERAEFGQIAVRPLNQVQTSLLEPKLAAEKYKIKKGSGNSNKNYFINILALDKIIMTRAN